MTKDKRNAVIAWIFFGVIASANIGAILYFALANPTGTPATLFELTFALVPVLFALVGALITAHQPRNIIGLIMMLPGISMSFVVDAYIAPYLNKLVLPPVDPSPLFLLVLWFSNWNWLLLVLPVMFIMLLFPTGKPLTTRWRWAVWFGIGIFIIFIFLITFTKVIGPGSDSTVFQVPNPIGFLRAEWVEGFLSPFIILFPIWILLCAVSLFVRFRRARGVEREQIKWLFYGTAIFILFYLPSFFGITYSDNDNLWNLILPIGMATFPIAIGIAILRYRLYDIDVIIRKTLQYALLTGLLALVYFGSVILLQSLVENLTGEQSPLVIVLSTLAIAAIFNPLRIRVQDFIDRRFYRKKYNAEQALAQFAATARDEVDMDQLNAALLQVVEQTMQPESVSLWLEQRKKS